MSLDHTVYVKTKKRSMRSVRAAAGVVLDRHRGLRLAPVETERDVDSLFILGMGGPIDVDRHGFGLSFSISTTTGAPRSHFVQLGELAEEIAEELGTVIGPAEAARLIEKEERGEERDEENEGSPLTGAAGATGERAPRHGPRVEVVLRSWSGDELHRASTTVAAFEAQQLDDGALASARLDPRVPLVLCDAGRKELCASWLECIVYDEQGRVAARYDYELSSSGRIINWAGGRRAS